MQPRGDAGEEAGGPEGHPGQRGGVPQGAGRPAGGNDNKLLFLSLFHTLCFQSDRSVFFLASKSSHVHKSLLSL